MVGDLWRYDSVMFPGEGYIAQECGNSTATVIETYHRNVVLGQIAYPSIGEGWAKIKSKSDRFNNLYQKLSS